MKRSEVPLHTRIGIKVTTVVLVVLTAIILRNCAGAVHYGTVTDQEMIRQYYQLGYDSGARQAAAGVDPAQTEPALDNPLLKKAYGQGFRKGWDSMKSGNTQNNPGAR